MDARQRFPVIRAKIEQFGLSAAIFGVLVLVANPATARAAVREAVKRALPATVAVEWHDAADKAPSAKPVSPAVDPNAPLVPVNAAPPQYAGLPNHLSMASGTIVSADGLIVTVIGSHDDGQYSVTLADGRALPARVLVDDRRTGLQLLKIDAGGLPFLMLSNQPPQIGEEVTLTYCLDLKDRAAGRAMIAATGRELKGIGDDFLQLDTGVALMSAGAPLVDEPGRLVGIVAANRASAQRIGFAVPSSAVETLLEARKGDAPVVIKRGMLGVYLTPAGNDERRVVAHPVSGDSPAAAAGVRDGDEILAVDGLKIDSLSRLGRLVGARAAGQKIRLTIRRDGKEQDVEVTLGPAPGPTERSPTPVAPAGIGPAPKPPVSVVTPDSIYIIDGEGKLQSLSGKATDKSLDSLRDHYLQLFKLTKGAKSAEADDANVAVPSIRVERTNLEKKLEEIGRDVQSLRQQMEKLTEELQRLQKPSTGTGAKP
jgi:serine protease Do